jgi:ATP-dependent helicase/nuclease subunit A
MSEQRRFTFDGRPDGIRPDPQVERDGAARLLATDPTRNVALEASAGTGKTRVLVDRYVRLIVEAEVPPRHILAVTFTRKAAAEMRQRVLETLNARHAEGALTGDRWRLVRDRFADISISTIDAFCLSLLHEFPLEAGVDPGFELADETETPRLVKAALDRTMRMGRSLAERDLEVALLYADLGEPALRRGLAVLLDRRDVAWDALNGFLRGRTVDLSDVTERPRALVRAALDGLPGGSAAFLDRGPDVASFAMLASDLRPMAADEALPPERVRAALDRLAAHVLTSEGTPRQRLVNKRSEFRSAADYEVHKAHVLALGPAVVEARAVLHRHLNIVLARAVRQLFAVARSEYRRTLNAHGMLDFPDVLEHALALLEQRDEFSRSRFKLEARYRHVLVDEFQDTSRAQWRLVRELMAAWTEGAGTADTAIPPSIFIVGDRKQSIYGFRDAEAAVLEAAGRYIEALRPEGSARAAITRSFRSVPALLRFVNDVFDAVEKAPHRPDAFRYMDDDRFPVEAAEGDTVEAVGLVSGSTDAVQADMVADEVARLLVEGHTVRDRASGLARPVAPGDIAVLFRTREGHRQVEQALALRQVPYYVYKGLGFFDADEIKDVLAVVAWLADSGSALRAAAFLRSRFVRVSDETLKRLAPDLAGALRDGTLPENLADDDRDRLLAARASAAAWLPLVDRILPADLLDRVLDESAYAAEIGGSGRLQARENLKKIRGLVRRLQNRGYLTMERLLARLTDLAAGGDESNAIIDAVDAVNLMTVHAAKGLEFPVVFVVNLGRGSGGGREPIRVTPAPLGLEEVEEPRVTVGERKLGDDDEAEARDVEETKRLLYVALTRARDRLYLCATRASDGRFAPARGSLGRVLPASLQTLLAVVAGPEVPSVWQGPSARHPLMRVVSPATVSRIWQPGGVGTRLEDALAPLPVDGPVRVAAARAPAVAGGAAAGPARSSAPLGTLVHRLLAGSRGDPDANWSALAGLARPFVDLAAGLAEPAGVFARAETLARAVLTRTDVQALLSQGQPLFEVAYSTRTGEGAIERGAIDCLVVSADRVTVVEFKTGRVQDAHTSQLAAYVEAARRLYPGRVVEGRLVYG